MSLFRNWRRKARTLLGVLAISSCIGGSGAATIDPNVDLLAGEWVMTGRDVAGIDWTNSTITSERQAWTPGGFTVGGHFNWTGSNGAYGREIFSGTLSANNHLSIRGSAVVEPSLGIVSQVNYQADVVDAHYMVGGTWGGNGIPSNAWTAVQSGAFARTGIAALAAPVPEPLALALLLPGVVLVRVAARRRHA